MENPVVRKSKVIYSVHLPDAQLFGDHCIVIFDQNLTKFSPHFKQWIRGFTHRYPVSAGEKLKAVEHFSKHMARLTELSAQMSPRQMVLVVVGGGSVGDFGGFVASILKRGVDLVHIPSTWLAAIDSAHGGKTALNVRSVKNQIGTFYPAKKIFVVKNLLKSQPHEREQEAYGELAKMALIDGGRWVGTLEADLWELLPFVIQAKYKIVDQDPYEKSGLRQVLNLGHTFGHVLESAWALPHGVAVAQGLLFALTWSERLSILSSSELQKAYSILKRTCGTKQIKGRRLTPKKVSDLLFKDKKKNQDKITFIFLSRIGKPVRKAVSVEAMISEAKRQKWIHP